MSESDAQQGTARLGDFLRDLSIELKSESFEEMRLRLLAFDRVDEVLASLREEDGIQVYRGADVVEEYRKRRQGLEEPVTHTLDYVVRKGNVELQLEVKLAPSNGFHLKPDSIERYYRILGTNSRTEDIVLVWATEELDSVALNLDDISYWRQKAHPIGIAEEELRPLKETIITAFERRRPILQKPTDIREMQRIEFDPSKAFSKILAAKLDELRDSAERRTPDRMLAIRSISRSDTSQMQMLFSDARMRDLGLDELKTRIEALCKNVDLGQDT
jgi:hypothetical protein